MREETIRYMLTVYDVADPPLVRLDKLLVVRQTLISKGILADVIQLILEADPSVRADPRMQLLEAVQQYDALKKEGKGDRATWAVLSARFESIEPVTPQVGYYRINYALLCAINAGQGYEGRVTTLYPLAGDAALALPEPECSEALGHLNYNVGKWFAGNGKTTEGLPHWQASSERRVFFYGFLKSKKETRDRLLAAAQQVAKNVVEFPRFFPDVPLDQCGVDKGVFAELEATFGSDELRAHLAK